MSKKFKITCNDATTICDKSQYGEASFYEILKLKFHFIFCRICGKYSKQNAEMSKLYKMKSNDCKKQEHCLTQPEKVALKKELEEQEA